MSIMQMISWKVIFGKKKLINNIVIFISVCFLILFNKALAEDNKILLKVNNEIITSIDILNEIKYLSIINDQFKKAETKVQINIARNSLIKEKVKMIELLKYKEDLKIDDNLLENIIIKYFSGLNIKSISDFDKLFKEIQVNPNFIKNKITIETLWNQLIYSKFYKSVKINEDDIKKSILTKKIIREYLLSEILINFNNNEDYSSKIDLVKKTIKEKSFSEAALIYSVSDSVAKGGKLGWISENILNKNIRDEINSINIGEVSNPIVVPGGSLILFKEDIRKIEKKINLDNEIKTIIEKKTNEQLNRLSIIYFNKIKKNILINEI